MRLLTLAQKIKARSFFKERALMAGAVGFEETNLACPHCHKTIYLQQIQDDSAST